MDKIFIMIIICLSFLSGFFVSRKEIFDTVDNYGKYKINDNKYISYLNKEITTEACYFAILDRLNKIEFSMRIYNEEGKMLYIKDKYETVKNN